MPCPTIANRCAEVSQSTNVPRGSGQRSWTRGRAQHDQGGKQEANGGKLAFIRVVQAFSCHGCLLARPAFQFYSSSFYVTHRFFVSFLTQERNVSFSSPSSPSPLSCSSGSAPRSGAKGCAFPAGRCNSAKSPARRQPPFASSPARRPDQSAAA